MTEAHAANQQVLITRVFDAPRELVFRACTDPDQVSQWFGPEHFHTPPERVLIDARVGGRFELTMVQKDGGAEFPVRYEIAELDPPRLLVLTSEPMPEVGIHEGTITRIELHHHGDKTRMTMTDGPYTQAAHAEAGWHAAFANLATVLADLAHPRGRCDGGVVRRDGADLRRALPSCTRNPRRVGVRPAGDDAPAALGRLPAASP